VKGAARCKPYIFSTSNCIFNGMPTESYRIMLNQYQRCADQHLEKKQLDSENQEK
jgi:hypothetical protein